MNLVDQPFPPFALQDGQGLSVTERDLTGHWTLLYAYPKDNTPGCTQEACDFRNQHEALRALDVEVMGISRDTPASHARFAETQGLPFRLISDPDATLLKKLGAYGTKRMYGKDVQGILRSSFLVDPQGVIRHVWPKVSVKGHVDSVLAEIRKRRDPS